MQSLLEQNKGFVFNNFLKENRNRHIQVQQEIKSTAITIVRTHNSIPEMLDVCGLLEIHKVRHIIHSNPRIWEGKRTRRVTTPKARCHRKLKLAMGYG